MEDDPVVTEIRRIREEIAAHFNYDLDAIIEDARRRYLNGSRKVIRLPPRRPEGFQAKPQDSPDTSSHRS